MNHQNDSVAFHSDDERELGINPTIASLSLGESRKFILKQYRSSNDKYPEGYQEFDLINEFINYVWSNSALLETFNFQIKFNFKPKNKFNI